MHWIGLGLLITGILVRNEVLSKDAIIGSAITVSLFWLVEGIEHLNKLINWCKKKWG